MVLMHICYICFCCIVNTSSECRGLIDDWLSVMKKQGYQILFKYKILNFIQIKI